MDRQREVEILEKKYASAVGFPFGTMVSFTDGYSRRKLVGEVKGIFLVVEGEGWRNRLLFFSDIDDTSIAEALKKNIPFLLGSKIIWIGPYRDAFGGLTPAAIRYTGKVVGYELRIVIAQDYWIFKPEKVTILNVNGVANRGQPGQNRNAVRTPNLGGLTPSRDQLVRAKAQLARLGRETTDAELVAEIKKVQRQNAMWAAKLSEKGGRKSRKNRRTRRLK
jgi:hypothetical protein